MNIGIIFPGKFPPEIRIEKEAKSLIKAGHNVFLLCLNLDNEKDIDNYMRINIKRLKIENKGLSKFFMNIALKLNPILYKKPHLIKSHDLHLDLLSIMSLMYKNIEKILNSTWKKDIENFISSYDIEVLHVINLPLVRTCINLGRKNKIPVIFDMFENWPEAMKAHTKYKGIKKIILNIAIYIYKRNEYHACNNSDYIIVVVDESKDRLINLGIDKDKIFVIINSVEKSYIKNNLNKEILKKFKNKFIISYTGTFGEHRGLDLAIKGLPKILEKIPNAILLVAGYGSNEDSLKELSRDLKIEKNVIFTGKVKQEDIPSYIRLSDICIVLHKHNEHTDSTIPHKLFEYMLSGKPVIVTDVKPLKRIVDNEHCGIVIKEDEKEFAEAILKLYDSKELYKELSKNGINAVNKKYNWDLEEEKLLNLYKNLK